MRSLMMALIALMTLTFASAPVAMADEGKPAAPATAEKKADADKMAEHKEMKKERKHHVKKHHEKRKHHMKKHEKKAEKKEEMKKGEEGK